jgi:predicted enzyme related to lactoylglutathione lyase
MNPVGYFEIPVLDLERAVSFYSIVFDYEFIRDKVDELDMAFFPFDKNKDGITGALVQGQVYKPSLTGIFIYFNTEDIDSLMEKVVSNGGEELYPKTSVGQYGFVAEFKDSEGNRIALTEKLK